MTGDGWCKSSRSRCSNRSHLRVETGIKLRDRRPFGQSPLGRTSLMSQPKWPLTTWLFFTNLSAGESVDVTLTLTADEGESFPRLIYSPGPIAAPGSHVSFRLAPLGVRAIRTSNGPYRIVGWGRVEASGEIGVLATLQYLVSGTSQVVTSPSLIPESPTRAFSTIAWLRQDDASTGIALLNPSENEMAEVRVYLFLTDGTSFDSRTIRLEPLGEIAQFLDQEGLFTDLEWFAGTAEVSSNLPIAATVIRVDDTYWSTFRVFPGRVAP